MKFLQWLFWRPRIGDKVLVKTREDPYYTKKWTGFSDVLVVEAISHARFKTWYGFHLPDSLGDGVESWYTWFSKACIRQSEEGECVSPPKKVDAGLVSSRF